MTPYPAPDTAAVKDLLTMMKTTLGTLGQTFETLTDQANKVSTLGPTVDSAHQIQSLRRQMRTHDKRQENRIAEVKHMVTDLLKDQIADHMRAQIAEQIRTEIAVQVRQQVAAQLKEHLPVSLEQQAEESKRQLAEVRNSLVNSEARRANSVLRANNIDDPLAVVLKPTGEASALFPRDLKTLFGYDGAASKQLVQDYHLPEADQREKNLNKFMSHIGIPFHLIPVPVADAQATNALGITFSQ